MHDEPKQEETSKTDCAKCDEYLAGWKRAQADYANLKRDTEREKMEYAKFANERLLDSLLPAFDQFENALAVAPEGVDKWLAGLKAVKSLWETTFRDIGLERIVTDGPFNPSLHEAVAEEEGTEPGKIVRVAQSGWKLNGKVLRPAQVIVSKSSG